MTDRWEYLTLAWRYKRKTVALEKYSWSESYSICRPGQEEAEERFGWDEETKEAKQTFVALLNELGAEGWELISDTPLNSTIFMHSQGAETVGSPISARWIFKRRASG